MSDLDETVTPASHRFEVVRRRRSVPRLLVSWASTLLHALGSEFSPPWKHDALIVDVATGDVIHAVRNEVASPDDLVSEVERDVAEMTVAEFRATWLP